MTRRRRVLAKRALNVHPTTPLQGYAVGSKISVIDGATLEIEYVLVGPLAGIAWPTLADSERRDGLWQHTCFEAFVARADGQYAEFNFSPSGQWASYRFERYREGMEIAQNWQPLALLPEHTTEMRFGLIARLDLLALQGWGATSLALSAVIEEIDGTKSYWALCHPPGKPDFHHPDCFALELPAPDAA